MTTSETKSRTYQETHSWITFQLDLSQASYKAWLLLGEAQSKCQHVIGIPLLPEGARHLHQVFLAKGVLATTAIEGNTLTEEEVLRRIEGNLPLPPSKQYLGQEVDNIVNACNQIGQQVLSSAEVRLSPEKIKHYNQLVLQNLPVDDDVTPGEVRSHSVVTGRYRGAPAEDCDYLLEKLCSWLNEAFNPEASYGIAFGVLKAIVAHLYIAWIHPFGDGNGRTARLVEFETLLSAGVPTTAAHLLSNHYNATRAEYYRQLDLAHRSGGDALPFIVYALQGFIDGLKEQIELIKTQQLRVHWINYVHDYFRDKNSLTEVRRKHLVLDLSNEPKAVSLTKIRYISPRIAEAYAGKTEKTVTRDINELAKMGLLTKTPKGIRASTERMQAFIPDSRTH
ncbi:MAG: Fic family protein [Caldilineales bacterium]